MKLHKNAEIALSDPVIYPESTLRAGFAGFGGGWPLMMTFRVRPKTVKWVSEHPQNPVIHIDYGVFNLKPP